jgi:surface protein
VVRVFVAVVGVACALRGRLASALYLMNRTDIVTAVNTCKSNAASTGSSYNWDDCKDYPAGSFGIANWNVTNVGDFSLLFDGMTTFDADIKNWNMATATDLRGMFRGCTSFNADISSWNTKNVVDMSYMFDGATPFNANIKNWDTSEVTDMSYMFRECSDVLSGALGSNRGQTRAKKSSDVEREREGGQASSSYARAREWAMPDEDAMDALARARRVVHVAASASTTTAAPIESPAASTRRGDSKPKARKRSFDPASML